MLSCVERLIGCVDLVLGFDCEIGFWLVFVCWGVLIEGFEDYRVDCLCGRNLWKLYIYCI